MFQESDKIYVCWISRGALQLPYGVVSQLSPVSFIDNLPSEKHSVHDIRLRFKTEEIWSAIPRTHPELIPNKVSKDISLMPI